MDGSKIKNIVLLILFLTNVFLLGMLLTDYSEKRAAEEEGWEQLTAIFEENGIALSPTVQKEEPLKPYSLRRDAEGERAAVEKLLGNLEFLDMGGNIYFYNGVDGQATFRGTGEFDIVLQAGVVSAGNEPVQAACGVLKKLGIGYDRDRADVKAERSMTVVTIPVCWQDIQVFNAQVTFTFSSETLILISGRRLPDAESGQGSVGLPPKTLLMDFLRAVNEGGYVCSEVTEMQCGYIMNVPVSGDVELVPVWRIGTDVGDYYFNGVTGREEILA